MCEFIYYLSACGTEQGNKIILNIIVVYYICIYYNYICWRLGPSNIFFFGQSQPTKTDGLNAFFDA